MTYGINILKIIKPAKKIFIATTNQKFHRKDLELTTQKHHISTVFYLSQSHDSSTQKNHADQSAEA